MTVILDNGAEGARTHVFIVGVGHYRHLEGGDDQKPEVAEQFPGMGQLTSTVRSAAAFADWVLEDLVNPEAKLGTVTLLLSPSRDDPDPAPDVSAATFGNLSREFEAWRDRCNAPGNVGIFFFAGHGLGNSRLTLLPEDFGLDPGFLQNHVIDFDGTHDAMMTTCAARTLCFIADACRPFSFLSLVTNNPGRVLANQDTRRPRVPNAPRYYACPGNASAYGRTNKISYYTRALLLALGGMGAINYGDGWQVTTSRLNIGIQEALNSEDLPEGTPRQVPQQNGNPGDALLTKLRQAPTLPVDIQIQPDTADQAAPDLKIVSSSARLSEVRHGTSGLWRLDLPADVYDGRVAFPHREYPPSRHPTSVHPQWLHHTWEVEKRDA